MYLTTNCRVRRQCSVLRATEDYIGCATRIAWLCCGCSLLLLLRGSFVAAARRCYLQSVSEQLFMVIYGDDDDGVVFYLNNVMKA